MSRTYLGSAHATAFHAAVATIWPLTGDQRPPTADLEYDAQGLLLKPYAMTAPLGAAGFEGSMAAGDLDADAWPVMQVTSVGSSRLMTELLRDRIRTGLLGTFLTVDQRRVGPIRLDVEIATREDLSTTPQLFYAIDQFRFFSTPA